MTKQESFKRRVRARMAKTGERYAAARQALVDQSSSGRRRSWVAEPELGDDAVQAATGRTWDEWVDVLEDHYGPVGGEGAGEPAHPDIAAHVAEAHGVDGWWAQTVTVGYERITGLRLPYQRADGTFTAGKSATVGIDDAELRAMLLDDGDRADLFPGYATELRSRPDSKAIRIAIGPGVAQLALDPKGGGRTTVTVAHDGLPAYDDVEPWKYYWTDWLAALDDAAGPTD